MYILSHVVQAHTTYADRPIYMRRTEIGFREMSTCLIRYFAVCFIHMTVCHEKSSRVVAVGIVHYFF